MSSITEAFKQLVDRYLIRRDNYGALIFFIRDRAEPEKVPAKAIEHLEKEHGGERQADVNGYPVLRFETNSAGTVDLALVCIQVDSAG